MSSIVLPMCDITYACKNQISEEHVMKRNFILQNEDTILRPVTVADAALIVRLRNQPHVQGKVHFNLVTLVRRKNG